MKPISSEAYIHRPHPEERALARVSKDGGLQSHRPWPSFETHRRSLPSGARSRDPLAMLLRMRFNDRIELIPTLETLY
jgi:hypothetical protein